MARDPYKYFRIEAREILAQLGSTALELEKHPPPPDALPRMLRLAHTLKGAARVVKQREIADLAHAIEDALAPLRDDPTRSQPAVDATLRLIDAIAGHVAALDATPEQDAQPSASSTEAVLVPRAESADVDALLESLREAQVQLAGLRQGARSVERIRHLSELLEGQLASPHLATPAFAAKAQSLADDVSMLANRLQKDWLAGLDNAERELLEVRDAAERLRLVAASVAFHPLERLARDTANRLGRKVLFSASGGDVRVDPNVMATVQGALLQCVRNAVVHGIEPESERVAATKSPEGHVTVEVVRQGNRVAFRCRDDGRGVDLDAVRRAAERKGVAVEGAAADHASLIALLLRGGISTSPAVTEMSGRGVGLDVVREAAQRLGGTVRMESAPRQGTTIELLVPVTLASIEALVMEAGGQSAAIPLDAVRRAVRLGAHEIAYSGDDASIAFEGAAIPFATLDRLLSGAAVQGTRRGWTALVVGTGEQRAALGIDRLNGTARLVVRALPPNTPAERFISGASLDAEGNPCVVIEPEHLVARVHRGGLAVKAAPVVRRPVLVVDDSVTTRMLEQSILESAGYEVDLASSGQEGLDKAHARSYALFLVDVEMPGIDGFTFVAQTRADPDLRKVPAILVTSRDAPEDRLRGEQAGASAYVVKGDFDQVDLLERIRALIGVM